MYKIGDVDEKVLIECSKRLQGTKEVREID